LLLLLAAGSWTCFFFFFFQAEDGIRDFHVTGVQTCALPILPAPSTCPSSKYIGGLPRVSMPFSLIRPSSLASAGAAKTPGSWSIDRKSTRLNSSHVKISYAVFCLKKKRSYLNNTYGYKQLAH